MMRPQNRAVRPVDSRQQQQSAMNAAPKRPWFKVLVNFDRRSKIAAITPVPATTRLRRSSSHRTSQELLRARKATKLSFLQAFGLLGPPLLIVTLVSAVWTAALIAFNFAPNDVANALMGTAKLDNGSFWLIIDTEAVLLGVTLFGLALALMGYVFAVLKMAVWRNRKLAMGSWGSQLRRRLSRTTSLRQERVLTFMGSLTSYQGVHRKRWVSEE